MVSVRPFRASDLILIRTQAAQATALLSVSAQDCEAVAQSGPAFTLQAGNDLIGAGGIAPKWQGSAVAWALVGRAAGKHWLFIHRYVLQVLNAADYERVECHVETRFANGHRWALALGFEPEGVMHKFRGGTDFTLYARVS